MRLSRPFFAMARPEPMQLIREKLEIGERMGEVPLETPIVPLQRDLATQIRHLKLKQSPEMRRWSSIYGATPTAPAASCSIDFACSASTGVSRCMSRRVSRGTFHENWQLKWEVDFVVALIERNIWGNTVESAAAALRSPPGRRGQRIAHADCLT